MRGPKPKGTLPEAGDVGWVLTQPTPAPDCTMLIYKILRAPEWAALQAEGETMGAPVDVADGYVHFSTAAQLRETAARHFAGQDDLWLLAMDSTALAGLLKWEPSRGGALFPHLYGPLRLADAVSRNPLPLGPDGRHVFPDSIA